MIAGWCVYRGEHDNNPDHPMWRRFGRAHHQQCARIEVVECARSECQRLNQCRMLPAAQPSKGE